MRFIKYGITVSLLVILIVSSCDWLIYDNYENCPRGVYVHLYEQTECDRTPSYPEEIARATFFVFDSNNKLFRVQEENGIKLTSESKTLVHLNEAGNYRVMAWACSGNADLYAFEKLEVGATTPDDLYLILKENANLIGERLYFGQTDIVTVGEKEDLFVDKGLNLREYTNRIKVTVTGFKKPDNYKLGLVAGNHRYSYNGKIFPSDPTYKYPITTFYTETSMVSEMTVLQIDGHYHSVISIQDAHSGAKIPFDEEILGNSNEFNLLGAILLAKGTGAYELLNPRCINDFDIEIEAHACDCPGEYIAIGLVINNWAVHSYNVDGL